MVGSKFVVFFCLSFKKMGRVREREMLAWLARVCDRFRVKMGRVKRPRMGTPATSRRGNFRYRILLNLNYCEA